MNERIPFCQPDKFSGAIHESVDAFLTKYNRASDINNWSSDQKKSFLAIYLTDTALIFYENYERENPSVKWPDLENAMRIEFEPTAQNHMLRIMLSKRKQLPDESIASFINDTEKLCKRVDPKMSQSELVHNIMKGLHPKIARYVGILDNNSLKDLKANIRKYESVEFMLQGDTIQSKDDIKQRITSENIYQIGEQNKMQQQLDNITSQISKLQFFITKNNNDNTDNSKRLFNGTRQEYYNTRRNNNNLRSGNNYLRPIFYSRQNYNDTRANNYQQNNTQYANRNYNNNYSPRNTYERKNNCIYCNRNNHKSENCNLICDLCNKRYHTRENCYLNKNSNYQKNTRQGQMQ
ncbi:probable serine/threonine-protein kinase roco9 [Daktulosphaira vitifoliae]|uniref:probable serine/threonine-protein kinase roco9 n=1 Tax=Daktulosphaira vitifoliae TaxID=58002 RepID=UPI0021AAFE2E|nr:probable serine/threonine-protein kinase roco9 [Daktulosphaira vitifoliae]